MSGRRRLSPAQIDRIVELRERGWSMERIARAVKCSRGAVRWRCLQLGAEPPGPGRAEQPLLVPIVIRRGAHDVRRFTYDEDRLILERAAAGQTPSSIGRELGRRHNSIIGRLMTLARHDLLAEARA